MKDKEYPQKKRALAFCDISVAIFRCSHLIAQSVGFSTMTGELLTCVDWLQQAQCSAIAMESTGVYWQAPYNLMEGRFAQVMIVNAQHLKRVLGRNGSPNFSKSAYSTPVLFPRGSRGNCAS